MPLPWNLIIRLPLPEQVEDVHPSGTDSQVTVEIEVHTNGDPKPNFRKAFVFNQGTSPGPSPPGGATDLNDAGMSGSAFLFRSTNVTLPGGYACGILSNTLSTLPIGVWVGASSTDIRAMGQRNVRGHCDDPNTAFFSGAGAFEQQARAPAGNSRPRGARRKRAAPKT